MFLVILTSLTIILFFGVVSRIVKNRYTQHKLTNDGPQNRERLDKTISDSSRSISTANDILSVKEDNMIQDNIKTRRHLKRVKNIGDTKLTVLDNDIKTFEVEQNKTKLAVQDKLNKHNYKLKGQVDKKTTEVYKEIDRGFQPYDTVDDMFAKIGFHQQQNVLYARDFYVKDMRTTDTNEPVSLKSLHYEVNSLDTALKASLKDSERNSVRVKQLRGEIEQSVKKFDGQTSTLTKNVENEDNAYKSQVSSAKQDFTDNLGDKTAKRGSLIDKTRSTKRNSSITKVNEGTTAVVKQKDVDEKKFDVDMLERKNSNMSKIEGDMGTMETNLSNTAESLDKMTGDFGTKWDSNIDTMDSSLNTFMATQVADLKKSFENLRDKLKSDYLKRKDLLSTVDTELADYTKYFVDKIEGTSPELVANDFITKDGISLSGLYDQKVKKLDPHTSSVTAKAEMLGEDSINLDTKVLSMNDTQIKGDGNGISFANGDVKFTRDLYVNGTKLDSKALVNTISGLKDDYAKLAPTADVNTFLANYSDQSHDDEHAEYLRPNDDITSGGKTVSFSTIQSFATTNKDVDEIDGALLSNVAVSNISGKVPTSMVSLSSNIGEYPLAVQDGMKQTGGSISGHKVKPSNVSWSDSAINKSRVEKRNGKYSGLSLPSGGSFAAKDIPGFVNSIVNNTIMVTNIDTSSKKIPVSLALTASGDYNYTDSYIDLENVTARDLAKDKIMFNGMHLVKSSSGDTVTLHGSNDTYKMGDNVLCSSSPGGACKYIKFESETYKACDVKNISSCTPITFAQPAPTEVQIKYKLDKAEFDKVFGGIVETTKDISHTVEKSTGGKSWDILNININNWIEILNSDKNRKVTLLRVEAADGEIIVRPFQIKYKLDKAEFDKVFGGITTTTSYTVEKSTDLHSKSWDSLVRTINSWIADFNRDLSKSVTLRIVEAADGEITVEPTVRPVPVPVPANGCSIKFYFQGKDGNGTRNESTFNSYENVKKFAQIPGKCDINYIVRSVSGCGRNKASVEAQLQNDVQALINSEKDYTEQKKGTTREERRAAFSEGKWGSLCGLVPIKDGDDRTLCAANTD